MLFLILSGIFAVAALGIPIYLYFSNFSQDNKLAGDVNAYKGELEKLKTQNAALQQEVEKEKNAKISQETELKQGLAQYQADETKKQEELQRLKREHENIGVQLASKTQELEKLSTSNANLTAQLQEKYELEERQKKEIERLNALITELNNRPLPAQDTSSQEELQQIKQLLEAKEEVVRKLEESNQALARENAGLKTQAESPKEEKVLPAPVQGVPIEEYNKLKEKLESAEKVLRLLHGAG